MSNCKIIINRQKAAENRKYKDLPADKRIPEAPTISIHSGSKIEYAYRVKLTGEWILKQDYANSPCSGAHIWLEGHRDGVEIMDLRPLSEGAIGEDIGQEPEEPKEKILEFF